MGKVAHALGHYDEANKRCQESLGVSNSFRIIPEILDYAMADYGWTTLALAEYEETARNFAKMIRLTLETQAFSALLDALAGTAVFRSTRELGAEEIALEVLTLVQHHPACHQETKSRIADHHARLVAELPSEIAIATQTRGEADNLLQVVAEWLRYLDRAS